MLRVIAGSARGHKLRTVEGQTTRPTTDRVKESLFNILAPWIPGSEVLDLFAGTGNLGIEALSRGAESAVFADRDRSSAAVINDNLVRTRLKDKAEILNTGVSAAISHLDAAGRQFDLIFMDPPYSMDLIPQTLDLLAGTDLLRNDGIIVAERYREDAVPEKAGLFILFRDQKYGDTVLSFYKRQDQHGKEQLL